MVQVLEYLEIVVKLYVIVGVVILLVSLPQSVYNYAKSVFKRNRDKK